MLIKLGCISLFLLKGLTLLAGCSGASTPALPTSVPSSEFAAVDSYIRQKMEEENIPGLAVAVVRDGNVIYLKGFGVTSLKHPSVVTPQVVFDLASSSKSFTAMGVLLLQDAGLIDIDNPFQQYVPDFRLADTEAASKITVRQLLNQTGGLPGNFSEPLAYHDGPNAMADLLQALARVNTNREPGSSFEYANVNYSLLGALIQQVSGMPFEDYMSQKLFQPVGLNHTTLYAEQAAQWQRADGHQPVFGRLIARNIPAVESAKAAGWVMSCAEDMARWLILQLDEGQVDGQQLLQAADVAEAQRPAIDFMENGDEVSYGMGWFIGESHDGTPLIWHGGDTPNFMSDMLLVPQKAFGVVVLANAQSSSLGHSIGPGVANLIMGLNLGRSTVPWWAYWKTIDNLGMAGMAFSLCLFVGLTVYGWRVGRGLKFRKRRWVFSPWAQPVMPSYILLLYITPLTLIALGALTSYFVVKAIFGFNLYRVLIEFRLMAPPGVWIAGVTFLSMISLWAIVLALVALFTRVPKKD